MTVKDALDFCGGVKSEEWRGYSSRSFNCGDDPLVPITVGCYEDHI